MSDEPLWRFLKGTPAKLPVVELSYQELLDGQRRLVDAERPQSNNPASPDSTPAPAPQMLVKKGGVIYAQAGVLLQFGVNKRAANAAASIHDLVPLTDKQVAKLIREVEKASHDLDDTGVGNGVPKSTAASAMKSSMREGREAAGGKAAFGVKMRTARGGGLVEAANPGESPYTTRQAKPKEILTPNTAGEWQRVRDTKLHELMLRAIKQADNG